MQRTLRNEGTKYSQRERGTIYSYKRKPIKAARAQARRKNIHYRSMYQG